MVTFTVPGKVVGKQRPRVTQRGGFARAYTPRATVAYQNLVGLMAAQKLATQQDWPMSGVMYRVTVVAHLAAVKSAKSSRRGMTRKLDVDNAAKAVLDGLQGVAFDDDDDVVELRAQKVVTPDEERLVATIEVVK